MGIFRFFPRLEGMKGGGGEEKEEEGKEKANEKKEDEKQINHFLEQRNCRHCKKKQGRIHGNPVADGWAGAVMQKPFGIQQNLLPTYRPTRQGVESRVRD